MPSGAVEWFTYTLFIVCLCRGLQAATEGIFLCIFMINLDDRILDGSVSESEMWLLLHITRFLGKNMTCWPSNKTLLEKTGWSMGKLQAVKKSLQDKKLLEVSLRSNGTAQATNLYKVKTKYLSVFVNIADKEFVEEITTPAKNRVGVNLSKPMLEKEQLNMPNSEGEGCQKTNNEVLTNEVLKDEVLINKNNNSANAHFSFLQNEDQENSATQKAEPATIKGRKKNEDVHRADALKKSLTYTKEEFLQHLEQRGVLTFYDSFKMVWADYVEHRRELRKPYKSAKSAALGFKELLEKSDYKLDAATRLVERTIAYGYQGLHPEKEQKQTIKNKVQEQHEDLVSFVMQKRTLLNG
jgi:hypothetical protein